ncbi:hypothetical protein MMC30_007146 [Trapelia coarctata]|nr:hypothetical protein [Trapelia coarctata]
MARERLRRLPKTAGNHIDSTKESLHNCCDILGGACLAVSGAFSAASGSIPYKTLSAIVGVWKAAQGAIGYCAVDWSEPKPKLERSLKDSPMIGLPGRRLMGGATSINPKQRITSHK